MGELSLLEKFKAGAPTHAEITVGPGSDCAVLNWPTSTDLLFKIDQVVEGTHFLLSGSEAATPKQVGWKAMAKTCSDIAAAGGWPVAAMVAINVRKGSDEALALGVYDGLVMCCKAYDIGLAGGDFTSSEHGLSVCVSLLGKCGYGRAWVRSGAKVGDVLMVTGTLGGSRAGKHLNFAPRLNEARVLRELAPRGVTACIDITDGLSRDLGHICDKSQCGARIFKTAIPLSDVPDTEAGSSSDGFQRALSDGEDFELLFTVKPEAVDDLLKSWALRKASVGGMANVTRIGEIRPREHGITFIAEDGREQPLPNTGYEHVL